MTAKKTNAKPQGQHKQFKRWDQYVEEADGPPFELPVSDEETILVPMPTGGQILDIQDASATGDIRTMLDLLCGEAAGDVVPLVRGAPYPALNALVQDMMAHFGIDAPAQESEGKLVALPR